MRKYIAVVLTLCFFASFLQVNVWADNSTLTECFSLEINEDANTGALVIGDAQNNATNIIYGEDDQRPSYAITPEGVPYFTLANWNTETNAPSNSNRFVSIDVNSDDKSTGNVYETIADENIVIEMWIRPYGNSYSGEELKGLYSLMDSVEGETYAMEMNFKYEASPFEDNLGAESWFLASANPSVKVKSGTASTAEASFDNSINGAHKNILEGGLNDGEWIHLCIVRSGGTAEGTMIESAYINGIYAGGFEEKNVPVYKNLKTADNGANLNYNRLTFGKTGRADMAFIGDIAKCNIYKLTTTETTKEGVEQNIVLPLYSNDTNVELRRRLNTAKNYPANIKITDAEGNFIRADNVAQAKEVNVVAELENYIERKNSLPIGTVNATLGIAACYDEEGNLIKSAVTNGVLDGFNQKTVFDFAEMTIPQDRVLNDVRVFVWENPSTIMPITSVYSLCNKEITYTLTLEPTELLRPGTIDKSQIMVYEGDTSRALKVNDLIYMPAQNKLVIETSASELETLYCRVGIGDKVKYASGESACGEMEGILFPKLPCEVFGVNVPKVEIYDLSGNAVLNLQMVEDFQAKITVVNASGEDKEGTLMLYVNDYSDSPIFTSDITSLAGTTQVFSDNIEGAHLFKGDVLNAKFKEKTE